MAQESANITDWILGTGAIILLATVLASWLASYRTPKAATVPSRDRFFSMPPWAQIVGGVLASGLFPALGYLLWIPLPVNLPAQGLSLSGLPEQSTSSAGSRWRCGPVSLWERCTG